MSDFEHEDIEDNDEDAEPTDEDLDTIENAAEFKEKYGFDHECRCAEDWESGNLGVVAVCYLNMCRDALEALAKEREKIVETDTELAELRIKVADQ